MKFSFKIFKVLRPYIFCLLLVWPALTVYTTDDKGVICDVTLIHFRRWKRLESCFVDHYFWDQLKITNLLSNTVGKIHKKQTWRHCLNLNFLMLKLQIHLLMPNCKYQANKIFGSTWYQLRIYFFKGCWWIKKKIFSCEPLSELKNTSLNLYKHHKKEIPLIQKIKTITCRCVYKKVKINCSI